MKHYDNHEIEIRLNNEGYELIAGTDEVGRGPLAGPVVAACCIMPKDCYIEGVTDSKKISEKNRKILEGIIKEKAISYKVVFIDPKKIDYSKAVWTPSPSDAKPSIKISFAREEEALLLSIENSGEALSENELTHIFDSFWRGSNVVSNKGSGLGLYICRQLMFKMGGDIFANLTDNTMTVSMVFTIA